MVKICLLLLRNWYAWRGFGSQPRYEYLVAQWVTSSEKGCLLGSGLKLTLGQPNNRQKTSVIDVWQGAKCSSVQCLQLLTLGIFWSSGKLGVYGTKSLTYFNLNDLKEEKMNLTEY